MPFYISLPENAGPASVFEKYPELYRPFGWTPCCCIAFVEPNPPLRRSVLGWRSEVR
jgi:hypothetical protein